MKNFFNLYFFVGILCSFLLFGCAASKVKVSPYIGDWHYTAQMQQGDMAVVMSISENEGVYSGLLSSDMGSVELQDLKIEDGKLTAWFEIEGYELSFEGQFDADTYTGTTGYGGDEWPVNATRNTEN